MEAKEYTSWRHGTSKQHAPQQNQKKTKRRKKIKIIKKVGARTLSAWLLLLALCVLLYRPRILKKNPREIWKKFPGDAPTLRPVSENYEKRTILQWKPMDLGGIP